MRGNGTEFFRGYPESLVAAGKVRVSPGQKLPTRKKRDRKKAD